MDTQWFKAQLGRRRGRQVDLARHLGLDPSAVTRILSGSRRLQLAEAAKIADFLQVPLHDVLRHAGLGPAKPALMTVTHYVGEAGLLLKILDGPEIAPEVDLPPPTDIGDDAIVVIIRGDDYAPRFRDGEALIFQPRPVDVDLLGLIGEEVLAKLVGGPIVFKALNRGSLEGRFTLAPIPQSDPIYLTDVELEWISPVLWHRPCQFRESEPATENQIQGNSA